MRLFTPVDFGQAARDYAAHRQGFPASFFDRLAALGIGRGGQILLDLGTGTGTIAHGVAARGARVLALDVSRPMLAEARRLRPGSDTAYFHAGAERLPIRAASLDAVTAGQCWTWFDGPVVARECRRVLRPDGTLVVAHFDYLPVAGNAAARTEELLLRYNPTWPLAGLREHYPHWRPHLEGAGFRQIESFAYDETVLYERSAWRGRMRACNGVLALRDDARIRAFDADLAALLAAEFADPLVIPHRVSALLAHSHGI
ncbi:MAG: class I SAM-dependent methyltransferase [Planctomycetes bacterium]|nr:class I SAM-dependent methyltransferase [Planctomycetota bacterium]